MADIRNDEDTEKPLDPATERVRRKMVRLLAVSIGIMLIGLMAVLAAVVYKTAGGGSGAVADGGRLTIALPQGSEVVASSLEGDRALLTVRSGSVRSLVLVSLADGRVIATYDIGEGAGSAPVPGGSAD